MSDDMTPETVVAKSFEIVRRGYSRTQVDHFLLEISGQISSLEARIASIVGPMEELGLTDLPDVQREFQAISSQIGEILEEARNAAQEMRNRAALDAGRWRTDAAVETRAERDSAQRDSEKARKDAWEVSSEMLAQVQQRRDEIQAVAEEDALFIRAEAERAALRLTGDSGRDAEEVVREARVDSDRMLREAQEEAEAILVDARQSAESAQARTRALEQRRSELMGELESVRTLIGELEGATDFHREALHQEGVQLQETMPVLESESSGKMWVAEDANVKIVPASRIQASESVDADALAAEVERLRSVDETLVVEPVPAHESQLLEPEGELPGDPPEARAAVESDEQVVQSVVSPTPKVERFAIDDLFATLRLEEIGPVPESDAPSDSAITDIGNNHGRTALFPSAVAVSSLARTDPFDVRDRHLLPITNRSLRSVKREIVELQNRMLEDLRTASGDWRPDTAMISAALAGEVGRLVDESFVAGHAAAAELVGSTHSPHPLTSAPEGWPSRFVDGLTASVVDLSGAVIAASGGTRQVAAAVSKAFRAWRTNEAEHRLRLASWASYNDGLVSGFLQLDVPQVMALAPGQPCGECAAGTGASWSPGEDPPDDLTIPPVSLGCKATLVPAQVDP